MSTRRAPAAGVFGPYAAEQHVLANAIGEVVYCTRCPTFGRRTVLVQKADAIGRMTDRCPACDGVAPPRKALPDEIFRPQALIGKAQLLPACPAGVLRCQSCAHPVVGDARLCPKCELPGLSKKDVARMHREREDREAAAAPPRPRPELPHPLHLHLNRAALVRNAGDAPAPTRKKPKADPLAHAVAHQERQRSATPAVAQVRVCLNCGATSPYTRGRKELLSCVMCPPTPTPTSPAKVKTPAPIAAAVPGARAFAPKKCRKKRCKTVFQPTGPNGRYCEAHR